MFVVHVALTPLAGAPIRLVRALRAHTEVEARLVNLRPDAYGPRTFPEDLTWQGDREQAIECIERADVLHFHHWFEHGSTDNPFEFDFLSAKRPDAAAIMHWHSSPDFVARCAGVDEAAIRATGLPQLVCAQYHERHYTDACPVPLIVELPAPDVQCVDAISDPPVVFFAPTTPKSGHSERWATKAAPEVQAILQRLERRRRLQSVVVGGLPFAECQRRRGMADVVIDDVITGSFHTSSLEAMAMGKATVAFLDSRVQAVLADLVGNNELPLVNVQLDALEVTLDRLCREPDQIRELGAFAADWMARCYRPEKMVRHYTDAYGRVLAEGTLSNPRYTKHRSAKIWLHVTAPDLQWNQRRHRVYRGVTMDFVRRVTRRARQGQFLSALEANLRNRLRRLRGRARILEQRTRYDRVFVCYTTQNYLKALNLSHRFYAEGERVLILALIQDREANLDWLSAGSVYWADVAPMLHHNPWVPILPGDRVRPHRLAKKLTRKVWLRLTRALFKRRERVRVLEAVNRADRVYLFLEGSYFSNFLLRYRVCTVVEEGLSSYRPYVVDGLRPGRKRYPGQHKNVDEVWLQRPERANPSVRAKVRPLRLAYSELPAKVRRTLLELFGLSDFVRTPGSAIIVGQAWSCSVGAAAVLPVYRAVLSILHEFGYSVCFKPHPKEPAADYAGLGCTVLAPRVPLEVYDLRDEEFSFDCAVTLLGCSVADGERLAQKLVCLADDEFVVEDCSLEWLERVARTVEIALREALGGDGVDLPGLHGGRSVAGSLPRRNNPSKDCGA